jgi:hypothetical protein
MMSTSGWPEWEELWRADRTPPARLEEFIERTKRARRALMVMRVVPALLALVALAVVAAALRHAGNAFEITLGLVVGIGIIAVWLMDAGNQRRAATRVDAPAEEYTAMRRALCVRRRRFANLAMIVTALDLAFLIPWWIGGFRIHGAGFHAMQLLTLWCPLALMLVFVGWTLRLKRRAGAELSRLSLPNAGD